MSVAQYVKGLAHFGLPTNDIEKTIAFYKGLGFEVVHQPKPTCAFLQLANVQIETYQTGTAPEAIGAIEHVALDVCDIDKTYAEITAAGHKVVSEGVQQLPFWENGVRFFTIEGPNADKVEFCQKL